MNTLDFQTNLFNQLHAATSIGSPLKDAANEYLKNAHIDYLVAENDGIHDLIGRYILRYYLEDGHVCMTMVK